MSSKLGLLFVFLVPLVSHYYVSIQIIILLFHLYRNNYEGKSREINIIFFGTVSVQYSTDEQSRLFLFKFEMWRYFIVVSKGFHHFLYYLKLVVNLKHKLLILIFKSDPTNLMKF